MVHVKLSESTESAPPPPALPPTDPTRWTPGLLGLAVLVGGLAFLLGSARANNSDIWLTLATGRSIHEGQYQFGVDPFSWASEGAYWSNPSWIGSVLAYEAYHLLGSSSLSCSNPDNSEPENEVKAHAKELRGAIRGLAILRD